MPKVLRISQPTVHARGSQSRGGAEYPTVAVMDLKVSYGALKFLISEAKLYPAQAVCPMIR
jgi:hypothetical protein